MPLTASQSIEFEQFAGENNFELAWQRLARSTRFEVKDWLGLEVYGWTGHKEKYLKLLRERLADYKPEPAFSIFEPKQDRSLRRFAFLSMDDRLIYQAIGNHIIAHSYVEILKWVKAKRLFGNIPTPPNKKDGFVFRPTFKTVSRLENGTIKINFGQYDKFRSVILHTL